MLAVSNTAKRHLYSYLDSANKPATADKCFRIVPTSHDHFLTLELSKPAADDDTYKHDGTTVLAVPKSLQQVCSDRRLQIDDDGKLYFS